MAVGAAAVAVAPAALHVIFLSLGRPGLPTGRRYAKLLGANAEGFVYE